MYSAKVWYGDQSYSRTDFVSYVEATRWISEYFLLFMVNWSRIDPNGMVVHGEVINDGEGVVDSFSVSCGL